MSESLAVTGKKDRRAYTPYTALTLDSEYCVCTYGDAASSLFGHSEISMLGKSVSRILPELVEQHEQHSDHPSSRWEFNEVRMEAVHANGKIFPVMVGMRQDYLHGTCRRLLLIRNLEDKPQA